MTLLAMILALGALSAQTDRVDVEDPPVFQRIRQAGVTDPRASSPPIMRATRLIPTRRRPI